jgi:short-subunit dehydrogenase
LRKTDVQGAVKEALLLGITLYSKALNGDALCVGPISAKCAKRKGIVVYEYSVKHTFGELTSSDIEEIAMWAIEKGGRFIIKEAQKRILTFFADVDTGIN